MYYEDLYSSASSGATASGSLSFSTPMSIKFQLMFWIFAEALLVLLLGLRCIEKGNKVSRILALIGLGCGALSLLLQLGAVWGLFSVVEVTGFFSFGLSAMGKFMSFTTVTMISTICGALIMRIKENENIVKILKWVAFGCGAFLWLVETLIIFSSDFSGLMTLLNITGVAASCFVVSWITALILSKTSNNEQVEKIKAANDEAMKIKMQEMVDEKVKEKMAAEKKKAEQAALPPLQDDSMPPSVVRDGEVKVEGTVVQEEAIEPKPVVENHQE